MNRKQQQTQLGLPFPEAGQGEAPSGSAERAELSVAKEGPESPATTERLMEQVASEANLVEAWKRVRANKGSPGVDGMDVYFLDVFMGDNLHLIGRDLLKGTYQPQPVLRVEIPKPGGGQRQLGVPTVVDRVVEQALLQILQPIYDPTFSERSYGFRPGRSAHQAVAKAQQYVAEGYTWVVDIDLEKFFDRVNHDMLMGRIAKRVKDKRVLKLIRAFLNAGVMVGGQVEPREEGTPQGGPLSPLLSNILLDDLDKELERRGHRFVRYADDCNIYVRSERAGKRVMESITRFLNRKLKLKVNQEKSAVARPWERKFLGFTIREDGRRQISPKAIERFKERVREIVRWQGGSFREILQELRPYWVGWRSYFGFTELPTQLQALEGWTRRRFRSLAWRHWKTPKRRYRELVKRGVRPDRARETAGSSQGPWHLSKTWPLHTALPNALFARFGLPPLHVPAEA
ncbi:MAG: group II intron reverse transcriptase/maturase [Planctomycetes bacterium]|nr:group II intron reverse transcriptase/maturase [Planctomycetota bacterium]